jgi:hypothetical protein
MLPIEALNVNSAIFSGIKWVLEIAFSLQIIFFTGYSLLLIERRKRKISDVTLNFFRLSLVSLLSVLFVWWFQTINASLQFEFVLAILLIYGLALSAMIGLLQKIVPFLIYLHLQNLSFKHLGSITLIPNMKNIISTEYSQIQFMLHIISLVLLLISVFYTQLVHYTAVVILANFLWLNYCLLQSLLLYQHRRKKILTYPESSVFKF